MEDIMKKKIIISVIIIVLIVLLFPIRMQLKDGGSVRYKAILYSITKVHRLMLEEAEASGKVKPYEDGYEIEILGLKIYSNVE